MAWMSQWDLHLGVENVDWTKKITKKQKVVFNRLTLEAVAFGVPFRAPASRAGNPGSRPVRCDGADPGGLHQHKAGATGL